METVSEFLDDVRDQIEADDAALKEARERLAFVRSKAESFYGALRSYQSGSLAAHTMNEPVTDGDGGLVLNRNYYPGLGPEGNKTEAPEEIVDELLDHLRPLVREKYPEAKMHTSKRGPKIYFHAPLDDGTDPTVDLVLALTRKEGEGIWIPNLEADTWEPSDPVQHIALFNGEAPSFRSTRRKIMRLAKAWNKQYLSPGASSFEMCVWGYEFVEPGMGISKGLHALFENAAARLEAGKPTPDPAGVSENLKLLIEPTKMAVRLRKAAKHLQDALDATDDAGVRAGVSEVFWKYVSSPETSELSTMATSLKARTPVAATALGIPVAGSTAGASAARAYGDSSQ
ncbi:hypothetical protein I2485_06115 [Nesterenkonia sp. E16_7]|uniref:hypothetical protein n=1 Tax=unclassified Nesterenkonia TaxID=2629769 RepID=UPI001A90E777|nr:MULTISPECIES: hypothetical protein [unclassified Nesterenkonia]MBO0596823.1 hypothetical protein [Nesterenkonia sp. E16_10]MBO0598225.1 hypothetical protein [Nesterenkonia sp. E16_7]